MPDQNVSQPVTVMTTTPEGRRRLVSQLSAPELDLYGNQLERCLKPVLPSALTSSGSWRRCMPYGDRAAKPASPSSTAARAMSAG